MALPTPVESDGFVAEQQNSVNNQLQRRIADAAEAVPMSAPKVFADDKRARAAVPRCRIARPDLASAGPAARQSIPNDWPQLSSLPCCRWRALNRQKIRPAAASHGQMCCANTSSVRNV